MSKDKDFDYSPGDYVRGQIESKNEWTPGTLYWYEDEVKRLQTEIERLQAALEEIANSTWVAQTCEEAALIARKALEEKK